MRWRIYYGDGSTYDGPVFEAPARNVQIIVADDPVVGRFLLAQKNYYWWDEAKQRWFGGDLNGMWDNLDQPGPKRILFGRFIPNEEWQRVLKAALADPDFQPKSARHPEETF